MTKPRMIPASAGSKALTKNGEPTIPEEKAEMRAFPYRKTASVLILAATMTRPDIAYTIRTAAKFCENLGVPRKKAAVHIL